MNQLAETLLEGKKHRDPTFLINRSAKRTIIVSVDDDQDQEKLAKIAGSLGISGECVGAGCGARDYQFSVPSTLIDEFEILINKTFGDCAYLDRQSCEPEDDGVEPPMVEAKKRKKRMPLALATRPTEAVVICSQDYLELVCDVASEYAQITVNWEDTDHDYNIISFNVSGSFSDLKAMEKRLAKFDSDADVSVDFDFREEPEDDGVDPPMVESLLHEASFRRLIQYTQQNGRYKIGGMKKIGSSWVYDPTVPGRLDNSRFVITKPPRPFKDEDGYLTIEFSFKSRPDRSTTGLRQRGWIKLMPDKRASYQAGLKAVTMCQCPDFKFRWQYALAQIGAAPRGEVDTPPDKTNPSHAPSLCKHCAAMSSWLTRNEKDMQDFQRRLSNWQRNGSSLRPVGPQKSQKVKNGAEVGDVLPD